MRNVNEDPCSHSEETLATPQVSRIHLAMLVAVVTITVLHALLGT